MAPDAIICGVISLMFLAGFCIYLWYLRPQAAFMDSMRFLGYFDDSMTGQRSLWLTWNQGDHRGLLPQFWVYVNARWFGYRILLAAALSGVVILVAGLALNYWMASSGLRGLRLVAMSVLTFSTLFSLSSWELYSLDVGVTLFAKNLTFIIYWIVLERFMRTQDRGALLALLIGGPVIIMLVAFGWSYAFTFATLACLIIHRPKSGMKIAASLLLALASYILIGKLLPSDLGSTVYPDERSLLNFSTAVLWAISSTYIGTESIATSAVPIAALFTLSGLTLLLAPYIGICSKSLGPQVLIAYALLQALAVAYSRGAITPSAAAASRYFNDLSLLIIGVAWGAFLVDRIFEKGIVALLCCAFIAGQVQTASDEWIKAPYRRASFEKMVMLVRTGVKASDAPLFQQPFESLERAVEIQRRYQIGPFRN